MSFDLVGFGDISVDVLVRIPHLPNRDDKRMGDVGR